MAKRIRELKPIKVCTHPLHHTPSHRVYPPGLYEHTCPVCGFVTNFTIQSYW